MVLVLAAVVASMLVAWLAQLSATQDSADLAALAGASSHAQGGDACSVALEVAERNHSELIQCTVSGDAWSFVVVVRVAQSLTPSMPGTPRKIIREATAGSL